MEKFEDTIKELELIVEDLNKGEKTLSESIDLYKKGLDLTKRSYKYLKTVEKQVKLLTKSDGEIKEEDFN